MWFDRFRAAGAVEKTCYQNRKLKMLQPGELLSGKYKILEKIGMGGMGAVYKAEEITFGLGRTVAIKVLPIHLAADEKLVQRFQEEMKILAHLDHPNIVPIHAVDQFGETIYYVMKYLPGETMKARVRHNGTLAPELVVTIMLQLARAVAHIHKAGAIHRDIKSVNIMIDDDDNAPLMDFGIAKIAGGANLTCDGEVLGTAPYMAPEQWEGVNDPRSDIYALGILMYEMLAGSPPFVGSSLSEIMVAHLRRQPAPLRNIRPQVPEQLAEVVHRCLAKDPDDRFATAADLVAALDFGARSLLGHTTDETTGFVDSFGLASEPVLAQEAVTRVEILLRDGEPRSAFNELLNALPEDMAHSELSSKLNVLKKLAEQDEQASDEAARLVADNENEAARQLIEGHLEKYPYSKVRDLQDRLVVQDQTVIDTSPPPGAATPTPHNSLSATRLMDSTPPAKPVRPRKRSGGKRKIALLSIGIVVGLLAAFVGFTAIFASGTSSVLTDVGDWAFERQVYGFPPLFNCIHTYKLALVYDSDNRRAHRALGRTANHLATVARGFAQRREYSSAMKYMGWALKIDYRRQWVRAYNRYYDLRKKK